MSELIRPYPSWVLNEQGEWKAPIEYPTDGGSYIWDEQNQAWIDETNPNYARAANC